MPDANDDGDGVLFDDVTEDVAALAEGKKQLSATGPVAHGPSNLGRRRQTIGTGKDQCGHAFGSLSIVRAKELVKPFDVRKRLGKPD
jgi:hypothetical protein